jgi:DNA-binding transcriptional ArsR family regulator
MEYVCSMPATADDVFHAISDPRRRDLINALVGGEPHAVNELVLTLGLPQPAVSKHLAVLREVGIVTVTKRGKQRLYQLEASSLKPVHDWVQIFERFWANQLDGIKRLAERKAAQQSLAAKQKTPSEPPTPPRSNSPRKDRS